MLPCAVQYHPHGTFENFWEYLFVIFVMMLHPTHGLEPPANPARFKAVRDWIKPVGAKTVYIELGSPWENGYCERSNARFRDELLNGEVFYSLQEAPVLIEQRRKHYAR